MSIKEEVHETLEFYRGMVHGIIVMREWALSKLKMDLYEGMLDSIDEIWHDIEMDILHVIRREKGNKQL